MERYPTRLDELVDGNFCPRSPPTASPSEPVKYALADGRKANRLQRRCRPIDTAARLPRKTSVRTKASIEWPADSVYPAQG